MRLNELIVGAAGLNAVLVDMRTDWKFKVQSLKCTRWSAGLVNWVAVRRACKY